MKQYRLGDLPDHLAEEILRKTETYFIKNQEMIAGETDKSIAIQCLLCAVASLTGQYCRHFHTREVFEQWIQNLVEHAVLSFVDYSESEEDL